MILTQENYFSVEAEREFMSVHQYGSWLECPARQKAILDGRWFLSSNGEEYDRLKREGKGVEKPKEAFLLGHFIDIGILTPEGLGEFLNRNAADLYSKPRKADIERWAAEKEVALPAKYTIDEILVQSPAAWRAGSLSAEAQACVDAIAKATADPIFMEYMKGEKQKIVQGYMFGATWKGMIDVRNPDELRIVDLKSARSLTAEDWIPNATILDIMAFREGRGEYPKWRKGPFYEVFQYWRQGAVYRELDRQARGASDRFDFLVAPVTKQDPPDLDVYYFGDEERLKYELDAIEANMGKILAWKSGAEEAPHCWGEVRQDCAFCRSVKRARLVEARSVVNINDRS